MNQNQLGEWLRSARRRHGMSLTDLGRLSGLDASQISRIETGRSDLTFSAAVCLGYVLGFSVTDILNAVDFPSEYAPHISTPDKNSHTLTIIDIESFWNFYRQAPEKAKQTLIAVTNHLAIPQKDEKSDTGRIIANPIERAFPQPGEDGTFTYQPLPYPKDLLTIADIKQVHQAGSVMIVQDLGVCLREARENAGLTIREFADQVSVAYTAIHRLENGYIDRLLVKNILEFDQVLGLNGVAPAISWSVAEFQTGIIRNKAVDANLIVPPASYGEEHRGPYAWDEQERALADMLVKVARWYRKQFPGDTWWLTTLRKSA